MNSRKFAVSQNCSKVIHFADRLCFSSSDDDSSDDEADEDGDGDEEVEDKWGELVRR